MKHKKQLTDFLLIGLTLCFFIVIVSSIYTKYNVTHQFTKQSESLLLNKATIINEVICSFIDNAKSKLLFSINTLDNENLNTKEKRSILNEIRSSIPSCRHLWIINNKNEIITDSVTTDDYIADHDWWEKYKKKLTHDDAIFQNYNNTIVAIPNGTIDDAMGLNKLLPITFLSLSNCKVQYIILAEFDLTDMLNQIITYFHFNLMEKKYSFEFSICDSYGNVIETSKNIPIKRQHEERNYFEELNISEKNSQFKDGHLFNASRKKLTLITKIGSLNLFSVIELSKNPIYELAESVSYQIISIGIFCLLTFLVLYFSLLKFYHKMRKYESEQMKIQFQTLQSKMNPHFLFNTLDCIVGLTEEKKTDKLLIVLRSFSYILHVNLRSNDDFIPLSSEIHYINCFVTLQKFRYQNSFSFNLNVDDNILINNILRLTMQPIIENCFIHAVALREKKVDIIAHIFEENNDIVCIVKDNGPGITREKYDQLMQELDSNSKGTRIGLKSIHKRVNIVYGKKYGMEIPYLDTGFEVTLRLPKIDCK